MALTLEEVRTRIELLERELYDLREEELRLLTAEHTNAHVATTRARLAASTVNVGLPTPSKPELLSRRGVAVLDFTGGSNG